MASAQELSRTVRSKQILLASCSDQVQSLLECAGGQEAFDAFRRVRQSPEHTLLSSVRLPECVCAAAVRQELSAAAATAETAEQRAEAASSEVASVLTDRKRLAAELVLAAAANEGHRATTEEAAVVAATAAEGERAAHREAMRQLSRCGPLGSMCTARWGRSRLGRCNGVVGSQCSQ